MKIACQIIFFLSAPFVLLSALIGIGMSGSFSPEPAFLLLLAVPAVSAWGWWRIKQSELTPEDIEKSR